MILVCLKARARGSALQNLEFVDSTYCDTGDKDHGDDVEDSGCLNAADYENGSHGDGDDASDGNTGGYNTDGDSCDAHIPGYDAIRDVLGQQTSAAVVE